MPRARADPLVTDHPLFVALGVDAAERQAVICPKTGGRGPVG
jgi:hypothetical protein